MNEAREGSVLVHQDILWSGKVEEVILRDVSLAAR